MVISIRTLKDRGSGTSLTQKWERTFKVYNFDVSMTVNNTGSTDTHEKGTFIY